MIRPLLVSFGALAILTGLAYPVAVTGAARVAFPRQAQGSLIVQDGQVRASRLIGQATEDPRFFWGRPSATGPFPTNAGASAGSTLAVSNPALKEAVGTRLAALQASDPGNPDPVPQDLVTASGSGLDPHLSPEAARWQVNRIARVRSLDPALLRALVDRHVERPTFGLLGSARVNVNDLNAELARM